MTKLSDKGERRYDEEFEGLFVNRKSEIAHLLYISWYSSSSRCNYWYMKCGGGVEYAGGDTMLDPLCYGPGDKWIDIRDFDGEPKICKRCSVQLENDLASAKAEIAELEEKLKRIEAKEFKTELDNDILRGQLAGIRMDMRRWIDAITVDEEGKLLPIKNASQLMNEMTAFLELRRVPVINSTVSLPRPGDKSYSLQMNVMVYNHD